MTHRIYTALGLMSGTSMDGIDLAILRTDGESRIGFGPWGSVAYAPAFRERLRSVMGRIARDEEVALVERELTNLHAEAITAFCREHKLAPGDIDLAGFHGQTIWHDPARPGHPGYTLQIGDGMALAESVGIDVVNDFRSADVAAGGQGAPLAPLYHRALVQAGDIPCPVAVLNIGGVANVTWMGEAGEILAFDTGPGNAMIDDWLLSHTGLPYDENGALAAQGRVSQSVLRDFLGLPFFAQEPPKSLDRDAFRRDWCAGLSPEDGAATLTELTVESIAASLAYMPHAPLRWLVTGGGRHNGTLLQRLSIRLGVPVLPVESAGWRGDALEAEAFAWLAVRSLRGLPLSVPGTTGGPQPSTGGRLNKIASRGTSATAGTVRATS